jgi:hypothetical protein
VSATFVVLVGWAVLMVVIGVVLEMANRRARRSR